MDFTLVQKKILDFVKNNKYVILVLGVGIILMLFPDWHSNEKEHANNDTIVNSTKELTYAEEIAHILSKVKGAGNVQVMLSLMEGEEMVYQVNENSSSSSETASNIIDTVTITDNERNESGLVRQINPPKYLGVIVVCQGADNPAVRLAIADAVSKITGLGTDRIAVLKMN